MRFFGGGAGDGLRESNIEGERCLFFMVGFPEERAAFDDVAVPTLLVGTGVLDLEVDGVFGGKDLDAEGRCEDDTEPFAEGRGARGRDWPSVLEAGEAEPL